MFAQRALVLTLARLQRDRPPPERLTAGESVLPVQRRQLQSLGPFPSGRWGGEESWQPSTLLSPRLVLAASGLQNLRNG